MEPELRKLRKTVKIEKKIMFSYSFSNFTQFGLNISAETLQSGLQYGPSDFFDTPETTGGGSIVKIL